jgi:hypothetical protein
MPEGGAQKTGHYQASGAQRHRECRRFRVLYKAHREYGDVSTPILALMKGIQQVMEHAIDHAFS